MVRKSKKSSTTLDGLARMVQRGFEQTAGDMKRGFDSIDKRFKQVDGRLDRIEMRLERIEKIILENHEKRIQRIEEALNV